MPVLRAGVSELGLAVHGLGEIQQATTRPFGQPVVSLNEILRFLAGHCAVLGAVALAVQAFILISCETLVEIADGNSRMSANCQRRAAAMRFDAHSYFWIC